MKHIRNRRFYCSLCSGLSIAALLALSLSGCQEDFNGYYDQPSWVAASSKQVLSSRGDCQQYLQLAGKTLFDKQVEGSGQYTFVVPTDEAFDQFFANNPYGYKSVDDIPEEVATRMVSSWMMYNSYPCDTLANKLKGLNVWSYNQAFKHLTPSYDVLRDEEVDGEKYKIFDFRALNDEGYYLFAIEDNAMSWHNNRYLPIFTNRYNSNNSISSQDWNKVVGSPLSPYGNYLSAGIIDAGSNAANAGDLYCQNGVIHLVDKVIMPLENLDAMIRTYGDGTAVDQPEESKQGAWKLLRNMLYYKQGNGEHLFFQLEENTTAKHFFEKAYPQVDMSNFRLRSYNLSYGRFALNMEKYTDMMPFTTELFYDDNNGGVTFFVPQKDVLLDYINNKLFRYIGVNLTETSTQQEFNAAFNKMSNNVIVSLWASMQSDGMIWPSQFQGTAVNSVGSSEHINGYDDAITFDNNVKASGIASNGMWQITDFVPKTAAFEGVASRFLLDPSYSTEENLIVNNNSKMLSNMLKSKLAGMNDVNISLILWGNDNMKWWDNIHYSTLLSAYANGEVGQETSVQSLLETNLREGYIEREAIDALDLEIDPLNGAYGGWAYTNSYNGGVLRYRKSGKTIDGQPEIQIQTIWSITNDENEKALSSASLPSALQQSEPTPGCYASVVKDNSNDYVNGHVYLTTEHSAPLRYGKEGTYGDGDTYLNSYWSTKTYLKWYLEADAKSENPQHTLFKKYFDYYEANKGSRALADTLNFNTGNWTIFVPTDAALQAAIDYGKTHDISLLRHPDDLPAKPADAENTYNWEDSVIYFLSSYMTKSGCFPDDGLSALYETSEAWGGLDAANREATQQYLVSTSATVTDVDRVDAKGNVIRAWEGLVSGGQLSGYVAKTADGNKLQYFGRPYSSGAYEVVNVYNSNEMTSDFDNTVVRQAGQSNILCHNAIIHSLNGFIIYKIAARQ